MGGSGSKEGINEVKNWVKKEREYSEKIRIVNELWIIWTEHRIKITRMEKEKFSLVWVCPTLIFFKENSFKKLKFL